MVAIMGLESRDPQVQSQADASIRKLSTGERSDMVDSNGIEKLHIKIEYCVP